MVRRRPRDDGAAEAHPRRWCGGGTARDDGAAEARRDDGAAEASATMVRRRLRDEMVRRRLATTCDGSFATRVGHWTDDGVRASSEGARNLRGRRYVIVDA